MCPCSLEKANTLPSATTHKFLSPLRVSLSLSLSSDRFALHFVADSGFLSESGSGFPFVALEIAVLYRRNLFGNLWYRR